MKDRQTINEQLKAAKDAIQSIADTALHWEYVAEARGHQLSHQQENIVAATVSEVTEIDGQGIEYWHRIATSALQTNDHLISRQRELRDYEKRFWQTVKKNEELTEAYPRLEVPF